MLTQHTINKVVWEVLPHLVNYCPLKSMLRGRQFKNNEEVKTAVQTWFRGQPNEFITKDSQEG